MTKLWLAHEDTDCPEVNMGSAPHVRVNIGSSQTVEIDKMYGPLIFASVRVRADASTCEWVVERETINTGDWYEVVRIPGQVDAEFADVFTEYES
jgi:hypothetical protein